ncbi:MAG: 6-bladed beta-propeller [Tannerella sp.]|nr:6-bladed beta-propeller [Tannerella sp.]
MIHYNSDSHEYISSENIPGFSDCIRLPDGSIIWHHASGYETGKRESFYLKITDVDMQEKKHVMPCRFQVSPFGGSIS